MARHVQGRRVTVGDLEGLEPGDYEVRFADDGRVSCVWFALPGFLGYEGAPILNRIRGEASDEDGPKWAVNVEADGTVTVAPSILTWWPEAGVDKRFHAYLKAGVWEVLDDCVGIDLG